MSMSSNQWVCLGDVHSLFPDRVYNRILEQQKMLYFSSYKVYFVACTYHLKALKYRSPDPRRES